MSLEKVKEQYRICKDIDTKQPSYFNPGSILAIAVAEYLLGLNNVERLPAKTTDAHPSLLNPIPIEFMLGTEFCRKFALISHSQLGSDIRSGKVPKEAFLAFRSATHGQTYWVHPKLFIEYLKTKPYFRNKIQKGLYKPEMEKFLN